MASSNSIFAILSRHSLFISIFIGITLLPLGLLVFVLPEVDQPALTEPLVILSVIFTFALCVRFARNRFDGKVDWFHPSILFMLVYLTYVMFSGVWLWLYHDYVSIWLDFGSQPAFVVNMVFTLGIVSFASFAMGMRTKLVLPGKVIRVALYQNADFNNKEMRNLILFFLVIGGAFKLYHLALLGTQLTDILRNLSPSASADLEINISQAVVMFESMLDWAALLAAFYFIVRYKETGETSGWWLVLFFVVSVAMLDYIYSGKRTAFMTFLLFPMIWYHYLVRRLTIASAGLFFLFAMVAIIGLLMARIILPLLVDDLTPSDYLGDNLSDILVFYIDTGEWSSFDMIAASVVQHDVLLEKAGGPILGFLYYSLSTLIIFIPRAIWPSKPDYEDLSHVYFRNLVDPNGTAGFAPTIWGSSFLFFHLAGLVIGMYVIGWLFKGVYSMIQPNRGRPLNVLFYSIIYWMAFQFLRFGTLGFVIILFVQTMVVGVFAVFFLGRKR